jgi:hypothetical protein
MAEVTQKPIFGADYAYTWEAGTGNTLSSNWLTHKDPTQEIGVWTLFMVGTGAVNLTMNLYFRMGEGSTIYSPVAHAVGGYINGQTSAQTTWQAANGFEAHLHKNSWWTFNPDGFKLILTRASDVEVDLTYAGMKAF